MEEVEEMTALSLGIGASGEHSKSSRGNCHVLFPEQLPGETGQEDHENSDGHARKKLRLSEEQLTVLETVYEEHSNLDIAVKQGLAKNLNIKPRQVEVWFQNRRARSKQKQTAADCENLKRRSEGLIMENQKLKRELQELISVSMPDLQLHGNTHSRSNSVAMCSSCNEIFRDHHSHKKLSKQKQTAADCANLKRRSEGLTKENQKLKRELHELIIVSKPDLQLHGNTHSGSNSVAMCSSCNEIFRDHQSHKKL